MIAVVVTSALVGTAACGTRTDADQGVGAPIEVTGRVADTTTRVSLPALTPPPVPLDAGFAPPLAGATAKSAAAPAGSRTSTPGGSATAGTPLRLTAVEVRTGDRVDAGDPIARMDDAPFTLAATLAAADTRVAQTQVRVLDESIEDTRDKERELLDKRAEVEDALTTLRTKRADLLDKQSQARTALATLEGNLPKLDVGLGQIDTGWAQARTGATTLADKRSELTDGIAQLTVVRARLVAARDQMRRAASTASAHPARPRAAALLPAVSHDAGTTTRPTTRPATRPTPSPTTSPAPPASPTTATPAPPAVTTPATGAPGTPSTSASSAPAPTPAPTHPNPAQPIPPTPTTTQPSRQAPGRPIPAVPSPAERARRLADLDQAIAQLDGKLAQARRGLTTLTAKQKEVAAKTAQAQQARTTLLSKRTQARARREKLRAGLAAMAEGLTKVDDGIVKATDGLATIDDGLEKIRDARRQLQAARRQAVVAVDASGVSEKQAGLNRERTLVLAPVSGRVTSVAQVGAVLSPGATVTTIAADADTGRPRLIAWIPPAQAATLCPGATAIIGADWLTASVPGTVSLIAPTAEFPPSSQSTDEVHLMRAIAVEVRPDDGAAAALPAGAPVDLRITPCATRDSSTPTTQR